ncbi:ribosomal protein L37AE/L43A [Bacillus ectoiniformans]|uniref:nuclease-related domain-containing protein n=1 Tax=Bacillus ectoiniformans TaxID=1494429 RepID=UPI00195EDE37|nr:nuclease-related domain-containing protein [Bacillus ectoiniformans]MBM7648716.1 ribosomal protein L37AE/L43A [Bacillus ectoiniformans]
MIIKEREIPLSILKCQALLRRLPPDHPQYPFIQENLRKQIAGYRGEQAIDFPLSYLDEKTYSILHSTRLKGKQHYFQMDTIVICARFILILEVKNMAGTLFFDREYNQLIRTKDGEEMTLADPILQASRQEEELGNWCRKHRFPEIPILSFVVISHPATRISSSSTHLHQKVLHGNYLPTKIKTIESLHSKNILDQKQIKKLGRYMINHHVPKDDPVLEQYKILQSEIIKGVHCPNCAHLPMERVYGNWICPVCSFKNKDSHLAALFDYSLLLGMTITNAEAREFLRISSPCLTKRLLQTLDLPFLGANKGQIYELNRFYQERIKNHN